MDQNSENPNAGNEPLFEEPPVSQPTPPPVETTENVPPASSEVIDVQTGPASDAPQPPSYSDEPPLQPEIVSGPTQAPPQKGTNGWVIALIVLLVLCCCCILLFFPVVFMGRVLGSILGGIYNTIISVLNSIFGGAVRFY